jgi:hypothetical protein
MISNLFYYHLHQLALQKVIFVYKFSLSVNINFSCTVVLNNLIMESFLFIVDKNYFLNFTLSDILISMSS